MKILDGKKSNKEIAIALKNTIATFPDAPKMVIIQIGDNSASNVYIAKKTKYAHSIGAKVHLKKFDATISQAELISEIQDLNADTSVHGVIVQLPIPKHIDFSTTVNNIVPEKDIDGLGAINMYKLMTHDETGLIPATARAVVSLLQKNEIELRGARVVVVGRSMLVGKSTALHMLNQDATVTVCHRETKHLADYTKTADIIVVAAGAPGVITDAHITAGQIVVDVGISVVNGTVVGDTKIERPNILQAISPVPGGVGPMTVASLFENLVKTYQMQNSIKKV